MNVSEVKNIIITVKMFELWSTKPPQQLFKLHPVYDALSRT